MADNLQGNLESTADNPVNNPESTADNLVNNPESMANSPVNNSELMTNNVQNIGAGSEIFEKIAISQLMQKYNVGRTQFYDRTKYLQITCWKVSGKAYLDSEQVAHMDGLHEHIREHGRMDGYPVPPSSGPLKASETENAIVVKQQGQSLLESEPDYIETKSSAYSNTPADDIAKVARRGAERAAAVLAGEDAVVNYLLENPDKLPDDLRATVEASRARLDLASQRRQEQYNPDFFAQMAIASLQSKA